MGIVVDRSLASTAARDRFNAYRQCNNMARQHVRSEGKFVSPRTACLKLMRICTTSSSSSSNSSAMTTYPDWAQAPSSWPKALQGFRKTPPVTNVDKHTLTPSVSSTYVCHCRYRVAACYVACTPSHRATCDDHRSQEQTHMSVLCRYRVAVITSYRLRAHQVTALMTLII